MHLNSISSRQTDSFASFEYLETGGCCCCSLGREMLALNGSGAVCSSQSCCSSGHGGAGGLGAGPILMMLVQERVPWGMSGVGDASCVRTWPAVEVECVGRDAPGVWGVRAQVWDLLEVIFHVTLGAGVRMLCVRLPALPHLRFKPNISISWKFPCLLPHALCPALCERS